MIDESKLSPKGKAQLARLQAEMRTLYASLPQATPEEARRQFEAGRRLRGLPPMSESDRKEGSKEI